MLEKWANRPDVIKELYIPTRIVKSESVEKAEELLVNSEPCVSFDIVHCSHFSQKGAWVLLDFGKELCGGIRIITREVKNQPAALRIVFGESVTEACSDIGFKNATNDHSPRDITVQVSTMSDLVFGSTGFRFAKIELIEDNPVDIQSVYAVNTLPYFEREGSIKISDNELNDIINTAYYTLKLNFQNGYIWDGVKRDRIVWSGDLNQEIITSLYLFGDNPNIPNSLSFLEASTPITSWMNGLPTYSIWWVINLCDYCAISGKQDYFNEHKAYAKAVIEKIESGIDKQGNMKFADDEETVQFFFDWPTRYSEEAVIGSACLIMMAADKYLKMEENAACRRIKTKLARYLDMESSFKQVRAFQVLAGRRAEGDIQFLEAGGAKGFSVFMTYYILSAIQLLGGKNAVAILKEYYGGMLSRGATTFWEDFDIEWLKGSGRIDEFPKEGERDIHGDYGNHCYEGFRHSLCHGWSCGVLTYIIEYVFGIHFENGGKVVHIKPNAADIDYNVKLPVRDGWLEIDYKNGNLEISSPNSISIER